MSEKEFNEIFSSNLVRYLESRNMSQNELAKYLGVSPTSVNNWCRGLKSPRMDKVDKICELFGISRSDLMNEHPDDEPTYYIKPEAAEAAKELYERDELRVLFDAARDVSEEDIRYVAALLEKLKKKEGK